MLSPPPFSPEIITTGTAEGHPTEGRRKVGDEGRKSFFYFRGETGGYGGKTMVVAERRQKIKEENQAEISPRMLIKLRG